MGGEFSFCLGECQAFALLYFFSKSVIILVELFHRVRHHKNVVSRSQVVFAISFLVSQFDAKALFVPSTNVLLHSSLNRIE